MKNKDTPSVSPSAAAWRSAAEKLTDQQLWSFGYDIRRPEGNLLIETGCTRIVAPAESDCSSCYQARLTTGEKLTLRGFGLLCEDRTESCAVFLHRDLFEVSWLASWPTDLPWRPQDAPSGGGVPLGEHKRAALLVQQASHWIADYEQEITRRLGTPYRELALEERGKRIACDPATISHRWRQIADDLARWPELIGGARPRRKPKRRRKAKALSTR